ncbi:MAG: DUF1269 domain-containing protein [Anaerolineales bacterium]|nr:DUF1269 domain-containing protein [Anaerolineales bacterium]
MNINSEDTDIQLLLASFPTISAAQAAHKALHQAKKEKNLQCIDVALVVHNENNKINIRESEDVDAKRGAAFGGLVGLLVGLLVGPMGVAVALPTGAVLGGLAAYAIDMGIPNNRLQEIGEALKPNTAAIVAIVQQEWATAVAQQLETNGGTVLTTRIDQSLPQKLEEVATQIDIAPRDTP